MLEYKVSRKSNGIFYKFPSILTMNFVTLPCYILIFAHIQICQYCSQYLNISMHVHNSVC
jgi:hypothetical protein